MGIHASPTCVLAYGDDGGAVGYLVGEENAGHALHVHDDEQRPPRRSGSRAWPSPSAPTSRRSRYAQERTQGRAPGAPPGEQSPIIEHPDVRRMLLTMKAYIEAHARRSLYLNAERIDLAAAPPRRRRSAQRRPGAGRPADPAHQGLVHRPRRRAAPRSPSRSTAAWATSRRPGVAQHYRDARIAPIYEGTNGIQAMDLVGRKLGRARRRRGRTTSSHEMARTSTPSSAAAARSSPPSGRPLADAAAALADATDWILANGLADPATRWPGATPYLRMFGLVTGGWLLARPPLAAHGFLPTGAADAGFLDDKVAAPLLRDSAPAAARRLALRRSRPVPTTCSPSRRSASAPDLRVALDRAPLVRET